MNSEGVIISQELTNSLIKLGIDEGLIEPRRANNPLTFDRHSTEELLSTLILFGKVHVRSEKAKTNTRILNLDNDFYEAKSLVQQDILEIHTGFKDFGYVYYKTKVNDFFNKRQLVLLNIKNKLNLTEKEILTYSMCYDKITDAINNYREREANHFIKDLSKSALDRNILSLNIEYDLTKRFPKYSKEITNILNSYNELRFFIKLSNSQNLPAKTFINSKLSNKIPNDVSLNEDAYRLYQIILEEDYTFPQPKNLKSTIELMNDSRIKNFREILNFWMNNIRVGDVKEELKFRKEIKKAKSDLAKVSSRKKIGNIISYVTLPISVASAIMGFPAGIFLSPIGPVITIKNKIEEKKHNWLLLGKL